MGKQRIIVIGGVAAGPAAAVQASRTDPTADVTLFEEGRDISYGACEMPYLLGGQVESAADLVVNTPEEFERSRGVTTLTLHRVESIDPAGRRIVVADRVSGTVTEERFDKLMLATGARTLWPEGDGFEGPRVHGFRTLDDAQRVQAAARFRGQRWVILGGGFVGLEVADQLAEAGHRVTILAPGGAMGSRLAPDLQRVLEAALASRGIGVRKARGLQIRHDVVGTPIAVKSDDGELIGTDQVVVATGIAPRTELAAGAGLKVGRSGIWCDAHMRTSSSVVWTCGDCAEVRDLITGRQVNVPLSPVAFRTARVAGHNAARRGRQAPRSFEGAVGAFALVAAGLEVGLAGISLQGATEAGLDAVGASITHGSRAGHMAGREPLHVHLVAERRTRRLLGVQLVGADGAALRTNAVVSLLRSGGTVDDLYDLDLVYTPAVSPSLDPLLVAARAAQKKLDT